MFKGVQNIHPAIKTMFQGGFCAGVCAGFCVPNSVQITHNSLTDKRVVKKPFWFPLATGVVGMAGVACIPFLVTHYCVDGTYFDRIYDHLNERYCIQVRRYYQYDGNGNKYGYPSLIRVEITEKSQKPMPNSVNRTDCVSIIP